MRSRARGAGRRLQPQGQCPRETVARARGPEAGRRRDKRKEDRRKEDRMKEDRRDRKERHRGKEDWRGEEDSLGSRRRGACMGRRRQGRRSAAVLLQPPAPPACPVYSSASTRPEWGRLEAKTTRGETYRDETGRGGRGGPYHRSLSHSHMPGSRSSPVPWPLPLHRATAYQHTHIRL